MTANAFHATGRPVRRSEVACLDVRLSDVRQLALRGQHYLMSKNPVGFVGAPG